MTYRDDVADPLNEEAEERFYLAAVRRFGALAVEDTRDLHLAGDFIIRHGECVEWRVDVKCDRQAYRSRRVPYEEGHLYRNGRFQVGWGPDESLDFVVFVTPEDWCARWVKLREFRAHVEDRCTQAGEWGEFDVLPGGWARIDNAERNVDRGYRTQGYAVPLAEIEHCIVDVWDLSASLVVAR